MPSRLPRHTRQDVIRDIASLMSTVGEDGLPPLLAVADRRRDLFDTPVFTIHRFLQKGAGLVPEFYFIHGRRHEQMRRYFKPSPRGTPVQRMT